MNIEIDTKTIKNRLFKILKIKSIKDYNNLKKKINKSSEITRLILPSVIFKLSVYDYNFKYIKKPHYTFTYISFCTKIVSKFNNKLKKVLYFYKLIKNIFQKKNISNNDLIILTKHKYIDQLNFFPLSNKIKKKNLVFFDFKSDDTDYSYYYKYYKNKFFDLNKYINLFDFINGYIQFNKMKKNLDTIPINTSNLRDKNFIKKEYLNFFIKLEFYKRVLKNCSPKYFLSTQYTGNEALIFYFKKIRNLNTKFYAMSHHGLGAVSCLYLYYATDLVFVPGRVDLNIVKTLKKKKLDLIKLPKMKVIGSVRYQYWKNHIKTKRIKNKRIKILFISTNPIHYKDPIEKNAVKIFIKFSLKNPQFDYLIKERPIFKNNFLNYHLKNSKIKVFNDEETLVEDLINESDICVGVGSSALIRQAAYQDKEIIQFFHHYSYMTKIKDQKYIDNYSKFENEIYKRIQSKRKPNYRLILNKKINSIKSIEKLFC